MNTKELIRKYNIRLNKNLGQNFLTDASVVKRIVDTAEVSTGDLVLEVGPGAGILTREIASRAGKVVAIEIDRHLIPLLEESLSGFSNVKIINRDVLKTDLKELISAESAFEGCTGIKVVANLPYYITTPIIMKFLEENPGLDAMVFMVQKEVADRMAAKPGGKEYGALTVAVQYYSRVEKAFGVPPHCFVPQPEVDSTVVRLSIYKEPPVELLDQELFFKTVKAAFGQRRKTLVNALSNSGYFTANKQEIKQILENIGIDENRRGETLDILQFAQLSNAFLYKKS